MKKAAMGLVVLFLILVNGVLGYFLYDKITAGKQQQELASSPVKTSANQTAAPDAAPAATQPSTPTPSQAVSTSPKEVKKSSYIYYIDDNKTKEAISKGKQCVLKCSDEFSLPLISSPEQTALIVFYPLEATIATPYEQVLAYSGHEYYKNDKELTFEKAKELLNFNKLEFLVEFQGDSAANQFIVYLEQDKQIEAASSKNDKRISLDYSIKTVQFDVASIDFTKKAVLVVQNKEEKTTYKYDIDFKKYVR